MEDDSDLLHDLPLTRHLDDGQRADVLAAGFRRSLARGEILFHEGQPAQAMYAVLEGGLKLVRYSPRGKELLLHLVRAGDSFAEAALTGVGTYPATAQAIEPSTVWGISRDKLYGLLRTSPELALAMVASVSLWTRRLASKLELLTQRRVEERLAVYLLARAGAADLGPGETLQLTEPKHLIAAQCGTAPEVLSRTLRRLEEDGVLATEGESVRLLDPERLRALAEWIDDW
jgi:CRP/FNR family transcriptional regulator